MKNRIVLLGMMGCGKSSVSLLLAEKIGLKLYDTDSIFEFENKILIKEFFEKFGEAEFRKKETQILKDILKKENYIISTGGGIILSEENRNLIFKKDVMTIYLKASSNEIYKRIKNDKTRPLLLVENPEEEIKKILSLRDGLYSKSSVIINTDNKQINYVVSEIMDLLDD